ncbi:MAG: DUF2333 family protein [Rickettsiales bacterium]|nr:DUF2333 family protein [Rickettsiales bacterium]
MPMLDSLKQIPRYAGRFIIAVIAGIILIYYPVGMLIVHHIDDSPTFNAENHNADGGSHAVGMAIAMVEREVDSHRWVSSDPFFFPGAALIRMPAYQQGIMTSVTRFTTELYDHIGRTRGSSQADKDLENAKGLFNYQPDVWLFDFKTSWWPTASSPTQYRKGVESLKTYNQRLKDGKATFERRSDNLIETLERMASDLGSSSATIAKQIESGSGLGFISSASLYYNNKGRMAGTYWILRELGKDYAVVLKERQLDNAWNLMLLTLAEGMQLDVFWPLNFAPDSQLLPNHLAAQGFYLMRARTQMREITNILLK